MNSTEDWRPTGGSSASGAPSAPTPDDPRVVRALQEYLTAMEAGRKPDRREFQARYPELAQTLSECLDGLEFVRSAAPHLPKVTDSAAVIKAAESSGFTPAQIGLAWLLHRAPNVLLIPGTATTAHLEMNMAAGDVPVDVTAPVG